MMGCWHCEGRSGNVWLGVLFLGVALICISPVIYAVRSGRAKAPATVEYPGSGPRGLLVETSPSGAAIYVDYLFAGVSPVQATVGEGNHLVEARLSGHKDGALLVTPENGAEGKVLLTLEQMPFGILRIESEPAAAQVYLDGIFTGYTPLEAKARAGRHLVEIEKANFRPVQEWVEVQPGESLRVAPRMEDLVLEYLLAAVEAHKEELKAIEADGTDAREFVERGEGDKTERKRRARTDLIATYTELAHYCFIRNRMKDSAEAYRSAIFECYKEGASNDAAERLDKEIKKHQGGWPGKDVKGFNEAIAAAYAEAQQKYPGSIKAIRARTADLERKRDLEGAFAVWKEGTNLAPDNPVMWIEYTRMAMRTRKLEEALAGLNKAVEVSRGDFETVKEIVQTVHNYYRMFPVEDDRRKFLSVLLEKVFGPGLQRENLPRTVKAELLFRRAITNEYLTRDEEAQDDYKAAIEAQEAPLVRADWRERYAILLVRSRMIEDAKEQYRLAISEAPEAGRKAVLERRLTELESRPK